MAQSTTVKPSPFFMEGGPVGVLLIHGFTGSPPEMRRVGDYLARRGLTVSGPCLPGHGTTPEDLNRRRWSEWTAHVEGALVELQARCQTVFVAGLSMGALLALYLAAGHPELAGAAAYSPALLLADRRSLLAPLLKRLIRQAPKGDDDLTDPAARAHIWSYTAWPAAAVHELNQLRGEVKRRLPRVTCPLLVIYSTRDQSIHPHSARTTYQRAGSADKELVALHNSGHVITVDSEWQAVADKTYQFIQAHRFNVNL
jgi:carboxylesterase